MRLPRHPLRDSLTLLLLLAAAIRLYVALAWPSLHHPDENFQSLEQAHRLAFGYGITPWEFHDGVRSMLLPWLLSLEFRATALFTPAPQAYLLVAHLTIALLSLLIVVAAYRAGALYSTRHALTAGLVAASWFQIVNFADRSMVEAIAADFLVCASALAATPAAHLSRRRLLLIGACLALTVALRTDLAPGAAVIALWAGRTQLQQRWSWIVLGAAPVLALFGAIDWITWGAPFHSYYTLFKMDLLQGVLAGQGTQPFSWLFWDLSARWSAAAGLLLVLLLLATRRYGVWVWPGVAILLVHSLIGHKEYRYIFPAVACWLIGAALVSVDLVDGLRARYQSARAALWSGALAGGWLLLSATLTLADANIGDWSTRADHIRLSFWLNRQPALCGLLLYDYAWFNTGGYAYLHRRVPMYESQSNPISDPRVLAGVNYVLIRQGELPVLPPQYQQRQCDIERGPDTMCVAARSGPCSISPELLPLR